MKTYHGVISFLILVVCARADARLEGYLVTSEHPLFVLSVEQKTSDWLAIGKSFEGFTLLGFDSKAERLTVEKDGKRLVLPLADGKSRSARGVTNDDIAAPAPVKSRAELYAHLLSGAAAVVLADVSINDKWIHVMPRETWKDAGVAVGVPIDIPRAKDSPLTPGPDVLKAIVWFARQPLTESWGIGFSDGVRVAGPQGPTIDDIREALKALPNQPSEPSRL